MIAEKNERKNRNAPLDFHRKLQRYWQIQTNAQTLNAASHKSQTVKLFSSFSASFGQSQRIQDHCRKDRKDAKNRIASKAFRGILLRHLQTHADAIVMKTVTYIDSNHETLFVFFRFFRLVRKTLNRFPKNKLNNGLHGWSMSRRQDHCYNRASVAYSVLAIKRTVGSCQQKLESEPG